MAEGTGVSAAETLCSFESGLGRGVSPLGDDGSSHSLHSPAVLNSQQWRGSYFLAEDRLWEMKGLSGGHPADKAVELGLKPRPV